MKSLLKMAYQAVQRRFEKGSQAGIGIDELLKLARVHSYLGGEDKRPKESEKFDEINVRWVPNGTESSTEE